jgi:hypothetical protein
VLRDGMDIDGLSSPALYFGTTTEGRTVSPEADRGDNGVTSRQSTIGVFCISAAGPTAWRIPGPR